MDDLGAVVVAERLRENGRTGEDGGEWSRNEWAGSSARGMGAGRGPYANVNLGGGGDSSATEYGSEWRNASSCFCFCKSSESSTESSPFDTRVSSLDLRMVWFS